MLFYRKPELEAPISPEIPEDAWPVVRVLRRDVPRPELPRHYPLISKMAWEREQHRHGCLMTGPVCAMGLHPGARSGWPLGQNQFPMASHWACMTFAHWFDRQTDPQRTVDLIWGEQA